MKYLQTNRAECIALVDGNMFDTLCAHSWHVVNTARPGAHRRLYVRGTVNGKPVYLHREVMRLAGLDVENRKVDHINGNPLDNRRCNLRLCTDAENLRNQRIRRVPKTSRFKGVSQSKNHNRWRASIFKDYKRVHLGYFDTPEQAARAYDAAAVELHGNFARTNSR